MKKPKTFFFKDNLSSEMILVNDVEKEVNIWVMIPESNVINRKRESTYEKQIWNIFLAFGSIIIYSCCNIYR